SPCSDWLPLDGLHEPVGVRDPAEYLFDCQERGFMIAPRQSIPDWLAHAVRQHDAQVVSKHRVPDSRIDTNAGCATCDDQVLGPHLLEPGVQISLVEPAE